MIYFFEERHNWFLWIPVLFGIGICLYFALPEEPSIWIGFGWAALSLILLSLFRKYTSIFLLAFIILIIGLGFVNAQWRAIRQASPIIPITERPASIIGTVIEVEHLPSGKRIFVAPRNIRGVPPSSMPKNIRLTVRTPDNGASPGDLVKIFGVISPPPEPVYPGAYDFGRIAYFEQTGAVGYTLAPIRILEPARKYSFMTAIATLRKTIADRIIRDIGKEKGSIAAALLVGESGAIAKKTFEDIRASGLAHLISISGLHLSLVVGIFYVCSRKILALSETLTLQYNIKKWAALFGLIGSAFYLLLAGMPIPAQRAYIMASLVLLAIIIDRKPTPMRCVAWAALIILIMEPESILTPSFQMSFAAVIALISGYRALAHVFSHWGDELPDHQRQLYARIGLYIYGIVISTFIAGFATLPFGIYHFNNYSSYSILANLVAIPTTSFWIMPWGVLALLLLPVHLENLALYPMQWGIDLVLTISRNIAHLPYASGFVPSLSSYGFALVVFGMCWLLLWEKRWRLAGVPLIVIGMAAMFFTPTPDIIIDQNGKLFAVKNQNNELVFNNNRLAHYTRHIWMQRSGQEKTVSAAKRTGLPCDNQWCVYETPYKTIAFVQDATVLHEACSHSDIVINLTGVTFPCSRTIISRDDLKRKGTHILWLDTKQNIRMETVADLRGKRLWVSSHPVTMPATSIPWSGTRGGKAPAAPSL